MRKLMVMAAMLAMVLAAAAPAFAQNSLDQEIEDQEVGVEESICTTGNQVAANQFNAGDQDADADGDGDVDEDGDVDIDADAEAMANEFDVSTAQVNQCFN